ncbi:uncharacterized protein K444DRAFT_395293 [Hyaloscypha bicolor E]|uniref:Uncharacterized protein n=1 Tax=Hyaloscypha bicolor E TaxID=1095630 RepID=A0A2J6TC09_9HELO|nr:uncharacterized protein K444DRAFT_395293 [Hyaloscypha bicolor E]PMD60565.1 hypothetical protein K444DRAFT_395293 [Hyaloscypha bicolor E]
MPQRSATLLSFQLRPLLNPNAPRNSALLIAAAVQPQHHEASFEASSHFGSSAFGRRALHSTAEFNQQISSTLIGAQNPRPAVPRMTTFLISVLMHLFFSLLCRMIHVRSLRSAHLNLAILHIRSTHHLDLLSCPLSILLDTRVLVAAASTSPKNGGSRTHL